METIMIIKTIMWCMIILSVMLILALISYLLNKYCGTTNENIYNNNSVLFNEENDPAKTSLEMGIDITWHSLNDNIWHNHPMFNKNDDN